jgi:hypothetical protein
MSIVAATRTTGVGRRVALLVIVAAALAASVNAQVTAVPPTAQWPPALRERVDRLADSARVLGLPAEPLYAKAAEGLLKGADNARIIDAVARLKRELADGRAALGPSASDAELVAAASVIHAGIDVPALHGLSLIRDARPQGTSLIMPLVVLSDLLARRVTAEVAMSSLSALLEHGARDAELTLLRRDVERDISGGQVPDMAARTRTDAVVATLGPIARPVRRPPL